MAKAKSSDNLTDANLEKVSQLLKAEKPITKKAACEILGITYNTSRLETLITSYLDKKQRDKEQREKKRYTPATEAEIHLIVTSYLDGNSVAEIAKRIYRSDTFVSNTLDRIGCPRRSAAANYFRPELIPDLNVKEDFVEGEKVWAARYNSKATIKSAFVTSKGVKAYRIWLDAEEWQQSAYQPWYELASLTHLKQYGVV